MGIKEVHGGLPQCFDVAAPRPAPLGHEQVGAAGVMPPSEGFACSGLQGGGLNQRCSLYEAIVEAA